MTAAETVIGKCIHCGVAQFDNPNADPALDGMAHLCWKCVRPHGLITVSARVLITADNVTGKVVDVHRPTRTLWVTVDEQYGDCCMEVGFDDVCVQVAGPTE